MVLGDRVGVAIELHQLVGVSVSELVDACYQIAHAIGVDAVAELGLGLDLVAFGHGHFAHVVVKAGNLQVLRLVPAGSGARP